MNLRRKFHSLIGFLLISHSALCASWDAFIDLKLPPSAREYCHLVRFPSGWKIKSTYNEPNLKIDYRYSDYEFRVEGLLTTWFLVGAFNTNYGRRDDASNFYRLDLSDPKTSIKRASRQNWEAAGVVPLERKSIFISFDIHEPDHAEFNGFQYKKTGEHWQVPSSVSRLSPDGTWLVLQSFSGRKSLQLLPSSDVFFDVFNTTTERKVFTLRGTYFGFGDDESGCLSKTAWLTERYFVIPLGRVRDRCVVCEFVSRGTREKL